MMSGVTFQEQNSNIKRMNSFHVDHDSALDSDEENDMNRDDYLHL